MNTGQQYLMVVPSYLPNIGGVERHVAGVHRALRKDGMTGEVVVLHERPAPPTTGREGVWIDVSRGMARRNLVLQPRSLVAFVRVLRENPDAMVHFHDFTSLYPFLPVLRMLGYLRRTFITFHGWEGTCPPLPWAVKRRKACRKGVVGSINVGDFIQRWYDTPADTVTYGGVDPEMYAGIPVANSLDPIAPAYLGRLDPDAGLPMILNGWREWLARGGGKGKLALFGGGEIESVTQSGGGIPQDILDLRGPAIDVASVFKDHHIIFASGYLTILEALCARRVVIACYDNPLRRDYLMMHPAAASMLVCGSPGEVASALDRCKQSPQEVLESCKAGWTWASKQTWELMAGQYRDLWSKATTSG